MPLTTAPLLVFDFDGVLVDGMAEYWWSARRAALALQPEVQLPVTAPPGFALLRPLIHKGWEMVLAALELSRPDLNLAAYLAHYRAQLPVALERWQLAPEPLQRALEDTRNQALAQDRPSWLALHHPYPGVVVRLAQLAAEGSDWIVLTTKGRAFACELLAAHGLEPRAVYGHEQGSKPEVLLRLAQERPAVPLWFVEDRRPTLEQVRATPGLEAVRCFLVSWGYLGPQDRLAMPEGIALLEPDRFAAPLASWP
jgi:phosphoglycolate phosphatase-like HAD superfamily hydrolase